MYRGASLVVRHAVCAAWRLAQVDRALRAVLGLTNTKCFAPTIQDDVAPASFENLPSWQRTRLQAAPSTYGQRTCTGCAAVA